MIHQGTLKFLLDTFLEDSDISRSGTPSGTFRGWKLPEVDGSFWMLLEASKRLLEPARLGQAGPGWPPAVIPLDRLAPGCRQTVARLAPSWCQAGARLWPTGA